jgi:hypothetical protein
MLSSGLFLVCRRALFFYYAVQTLRRLHRHRRDDRPQSAPPSPLKGFKTIRKSFLLPKIKWTYLSPYYLCS